MGESSFLRKTIVIGVIIGLVVGLLVGYTITPKGVDPKPFEEQINQLGGQINSLQSQVSNQTSQISTLQIQITEKDEQIVNLTYQVSSLQQVIDDLESQLPPNSPIGGETGSSRFFPAEIGDNLTSAFEYLFDEYVAIITLKEVIRGDGAWAMIQDANMFNEPPPMNFEYIAVKIKFEYVSGPTINTVYGLSTSDFNVISADGYEYEIPFVVEPEPDINADLYPRAIHEGWAAYQVYENDAKPVLTFGREYSGEGGIWFKLYK